MHVFVFRLSPEADFWSNSQVEALLFYMCLTFLRDIQPHSQTLIHTQTHSATLSDTQPHSYTLRDTQPHSETLSHTQKHSAKEINKHCRQVIVDHHRWLNTWSAKTFTVPHVHGDLVEHIPPEARPHRGTFRERVEQVNAAPLLDRQYCYTHRCYCTSLKETDLEMSGLPCEENSRANTRRRFFEGRFSNLYAIWAKRHRKLGTKLIILENTEETWNMPVVGFQFCPY